MPGEWRASDLPSSPVDSHCGLPTLPEEREVLSRLHAEATNTRKSQRTLKDYRRNNCEIFPGIAKIQNLESRLYNPEMLFFVRVVTSDCLEESEEKKLAEFRRREIRGLDKEDTFLYG